MDLAHRQRNPLLGLLPRKHTHFGLWREHRGLHGHGVRMRRDIIRQDQYGCLAIAHEVACDGEDEVGVGAVHPGQKFVDHFHRRRKGRASPDATRWAAPARLR